MYVTTCPSCSATIKTPGSRGHQVCGMNDQRVQCSECKRWHSAYVEDGHLYLELPSAGSEDHLEAQAQMRQLGI